MNVVGGDLDILSNNTTVNVNLYQSNSLAGQSNIILGWGDNPTTAGPGVVQANYTGSLRITGSNNIVALPQVRATFVGGPTAVNSQGYISGSNNIINTNQGGIYLNTDSQLFPKTQHNIINRINGISLSFTTSSLTGGDPLIQSNILNAGLLNLNHNSGSVNASNNILTAAAIISTQNFTTNTRPNIVSNISSANITLNHISSSINYSSNFVNSPLTVNNHLSSSAIANNSLSIQNNIIVGGSNNNGHNIYVSGSQQSNGTRPISDNIIGGRNIIISSSYVSSSNASLFSSIVYGNSLAVSGSHIGSGGSAFFGRFNATGSLQESSEDTVFVVGNGSGAGSRRNALRIDNNGNSNFTGSVRIAAPSNAGHPPSFFISSFNESNAAANITGSVSVSGSINITGQYLVNGVPFTGGSSGSSGTSGINGSSGTSGVNGTNGSSGTSGTDGTSGTSPSVTGFITTGSMFSDQTITGLLRISGSDTQGLNVGGGNNTSRLNTFNGSPVLYRNTDTYNTVLGNVKGLEVGFETGSEKNMLFTGFFLNFTSGSNNTVISGNGSANFLSGSNNTVIGQLGSLGFGNNNTYLGTVGSNPALENDTLRIGAGGNLLLVKSGSNALQIGSDTQVTGSLTVSSLSTLTGSFVVTTDSTGQLSKSPYSGITSNLFSVGDFYSTQTQTLAAGVSGSVTYNNTGTSFGVTVVSSSRLTVANAGVYSITFSAQLLGDGGQDTVYMWLKKNGTNVSDTATKLVVKNNEELVMTVEYVVQAAASDYYEIAWQNTTGDGDLKYYAASGNIPAIPSIITTVKQVR